MKRTSHLVALSTPVGLLMFVAPSGARAATTVFTDNFNRVDANGLGSKWTVINGGQLRDNGASAELNFGSNTMYVLSGLTGLYNRTTLKVDVSNAQGPGTGFQSVNLCIGQATSPGTEGLFLKIATTDSTGLFNRVEFDTGVNMSDSTKWTTNNIITPTSFTSARVTASAVDADTIRIGIDSNFDGTDDQVFTRELNLGVMTFGDRLGLAVNGAAMRADNFSASVIGPANVTWNVGGSGAWNTTTNNWTGGAPDANKYINTDNATFGMTAGGTITVAAGTTPGSTTVNASSGTYTFAGSGIQGSGTLTKQGAGRLVLTNANAFTGITTVSNSGSIAANGSGAHLTLNNTTGNALSGDLHIGVAGASGSNVAKVSLAHANQIADNRDVYFDSSSGNYAYFSLRGNSETVAGIISTSTGGAIENGNLNGSINADSTLTLAPAIGVTRTFGGIIRDADTGGGTGKLNLAVNGAGTQVLGSGAYSYTGTTTVNAGKLQLATNLTSSSAISVTGGAIELATGGGSNRVIKTPAVSVTGSGKLDLKDNKLIVTTAGQTGSWTGSSYTGITGLIAAGFNHGGWGGSGIVTSQSTATTSNLTSIGVATAAQVKGIAPTATAVWGGQTVTGSNTLAMYTYGGDANLDGKINVDDYTRIDFNIALGSKGWYNGDFNYDGKINVDDYTIIDFNVGIQGAPFATGGGAEALSAVAIPEPVGLSTLVVGLALAGGRRRRKSLLPRRVV